MHNPETTTDAVTPPQGLITLSWGLQPPATATCAWGARAIYSLRTRDERFFANGKRRKTPKSVTEAEIGLLFDRQDAKGSDEEREALSLWLNKQALPELRKRCVAEYLTTDSEDTIEVVDHERGFVLKASPRASYGYLYIVAYRATSL